MMESSTRRFRRNRVFTGLQVVLALIPVSIPGLAAEVQNCGDGGPGSGSLRDVITSAAAGETIDLSQLPTKCGMADSAITLWNGEIVITQDDLTLQGPSSGSVTITPAPGSQWRIFNHTGKGLLNVKDLTLASGYLQMGVGVAKGGCIYSAGSVFLTDAHLDNCTAAGAQAFGGGVYASSALALLHSVVSGSKALGTLEGDGGGVSAANMSFLYSTLTGNHASRFGGGAFTYSNGYVAVSYSTIDGNTAEHCGGAAFYASGANVSNSTISGNTSSSSNGGICVEGGVYIVNSTIAFNSASSNPGSLDGAGLAMWGGLLTLQSSIIAKNSNDPTAPDLAVSNSAAVDGADNLVMTNSGNIPSGIVRITVDPKLGPLHLNGGDTRTHALLPGSPAIGTGNDSRFLGNDQRGRGYPRSCGPVYLTDIGAFQFDSIFADSFN